MTDIINNIHSYFAVSKIDWNIAEELANSITSKEEVNEILLCGYVFNYKDCYDRAIDLLTLINLPKEVLTLEFYKEAFKDEKELLMLAISNSSKLDVESKISYLKSIEDLCTDRLLKTTLIDAYSNVCFRHNLPLIKYIDHFLFDSDSYVANWAKEELDIQPEK